MAAAPERRAEGLPYARYELALFMAMPELLNARQVVLVYHNSWPLFQDTVAGVYEGLPRVPGMQLRVVAADKTTFAVTDSGVLPHDAVPAAELCE